MGTAVVSVKAERMAAGVSPRAVARMAGVLYALEGTGSILGGAYFRDTFLVAGNAAATASAIQANETLFRVGLAAGLLSVTRVKPGQAEGPDVNEAHRARPHEEQ